MSIQVKNWSVFFEKYPVLHNIDLEFNGQGIFAVIGPSGCGKTTLLKSINRTAELDRGFNCSGKILLNGEDIYQKRCSLNPPQSWHGIPNSCGPAHERAGKCLFGPRYLVKRISGSCVIYVNAA